MKSKAIFLALLALAFGARATEVSRTEVESAVKAWATGGRHFGVSFGQGEVERSTAHVTTNGTVFYAVKLRDGGTVFTSGDTDVEPIIAFTSSKDDFSQLDRRSPLWALLNSDLSSRRRGTSPLVAYGASPSAGRAVVSAAGEWRRLIAAGSGEKLERGTSLTRVSDLRVDALVKSKWSQGDGIWNYYTPNHYVCGCVATAAGQIMRYFHGPADDGGLGMPVPNADVAKKTVTCQVDGRDRRLTMQGGQYAWDNMPLTADLVTTVDQKQNIGKLVSDLGISVGMMYDDEGSGAFTYDVPGSLMSNFGYSQGVWVNIDGEITSAGGAVLYNTLFANFDAGHPCAMSIPGHAIVADGYGYEGDKPYVHLNMGWAGSHDVWYNLPDITDAGKAFDAVNGIGYNLFPSEGGVDGNDQTTRAIISGRVLDDDGLAAANCAVTIYAAGTDSVVATLRTNAKGIWAAILPAGTYDVSATTDDNEWIGAADGVVLAVPQTSKNGDTLFSTPAATGNSWGNEIVLEHPSVRVGGVIYSSIDRAVVKARDIASTAPGAPVLVEVLDKTRLKKTLAIDFDCVIVATNETPYASPVERISGAKMLVAAGSSLVLSNIVFAAGSATVVDVEDGGTCGVAGIVDFGVDAETTAAVKTASSTGFRLLGAVRPGFAVDCATAKVAGTQFGTAAAATVADFNAICACAPHIVNIHDPLGEMRGRVQGSAPGYTLVWYVQPVPLEDAAGYYVDAAGSTNTAARIDRLFDRYAESLANGELGGERRIVLLKGGVLSRPVSVADAAGLAIAGDNVVLSVASTSGFTVTGGPLVVTGVSFRDYVGEALFVVDGANASLSLGSGVSLVGIEGTGEYGAVVVRNGSSASAAGVTFIDCTADGRGSNPRGGAFNVAPGCSLSLTSCTITNCMARSYGGAIYAEAGSSVSLSGQMKIAGNKSTSFKNFPNNINLANGARSGRATLMLVGEVTGVVGVKWGNSVNGFGNQDSWLAASAASAAIAQASAGALRCDVDPTLVAEYDAANSALRWTTAPVGPQPLPESEKDSASARVVDGNGTSYYLLVSDALAALSGDATVFVKGWRGVELTSDVKISHNVTIASDTDWGVYWLERRADCSIVVEPGASLSLRDITVYGSEVDTSGALSTNAVPTTKPLFDVRGGALTLETPSDVSQYVTEIAYVMGRGARNAGAVSVWNGGAFVMKSGSQIHGCTNTYVNAGDGTGRGGALLVDHASVIIAGGTITGCSAYNGGGAFIGNGSTLQVYGDTRIYGNFDLSGQPNDMVVYDLGSMVLAGGMSGKIGYIEGVSGDTAVFGRAAAGISAEDALASAHNFTHDVTGDIGMAVTGADGTLLVWSSALASNGTYTDANGQTYTLVPGNPVAIPVPTAVPGLVYNGAAQRGVNEGLGYAISFNGATDAGNYTAEAFIRPGYVWEGDASAEVKYIPWSIAKAVYDMSGVTFADAEFIYDGKYHTIGVEGDLPDGVTVSYANERQRDVGAYVVTASFAGDAVNYEAIQNMMATLSITAVPEPTPPGTTPSTLAQPEPIAFSAIADASGTWTLMITTAVENCWYTLYETNSITGGFSPAPGDTSFVERRQATATDVPTMIFTRPRDGGQLFWHVVAEPEGSH